MPYVTVDDIKKFFGSRHVDAWYNAMNDTTDSKTIAVIAAPFIELAEAEVEAVFCTGAIDLNLAVVNENPKVKYVICCLAATYWFMGTGISNDTIYKYVMRLSQMARKELEALAFLRMSIKGSTSNNIPFVGEDDA